MGNPSRCRVVKSQLEALLTFLYPDCCQVCGAQRATASEGYVCGRCWSRTDGVRFIEPPFCERCGLPFDGEITSEFECSNCREMALRFSGARAAVVASDMILDIVHRYKYRHALWFEPFLAGLLIRQAGPVLPREGWDAIVPVPLHPVKEREREFNQAGRLAAHLSRATRLPVLRRAVDRVEHTRTQTQLTRARRTENVRHAFRARPGVAVKGRRLVLVDDVLTTGATTSACAGALLKAGAREVSVWTVARGL